MLSAATRVLVDVMNARTIRRLVCITGLGTGDSRGHGGFFFGRPLLPLLLRHIYDDKNRQEDIIRASTLDWTIVRPTMLNDKPARGHIRALTDLSGIPSWNDRTRRSTRREIEPLPTRSAPTRSRYHATGPRTPRALTRTARNAASEKIVVRTAFHTTNPSARTRPTPLAEIP
ncbi:MAG: NAD(P)H-binding protein [Gluconacetobacter sp.]